MAAQLYVITPESFDLAEFASQAKAAFAGGPIAAFQLRLKGADSDFIRRAVAELMPLARAHGAAFILNDHAELAAELHTDGVHLGADDMPLRKAREIVGPDAVIGVSCYGSRDRAMSAAEHGADYVAFGQFFETRTKPPRGRPEPEILEWWSTLTEIPCAAVGGIKARNLAPLVRAGADFIAVVTAVWEHPAGPGVAVTELNAAISHALNA